GLARGTRLDNKPTSERLSSDNLSGKQSFRREKRSQEPSRALISSGSSSPSEAFLPCRVRYEAASFGRSVTVEPSCGSAVNMVTFDPFPIPLVKILSTQISVGFLG